VKRVGSDKRQTELLDAFRFGEIDPELAANIGIDVKVLAVVESGSVVKLKVCGDLFAFQKVVEVVRLQRDRVEGFQNLLELAQVEEIRAVLDHDLGKIGELIELGDKWCGGGRLRPISSEDRKLQDDFSKGRRQLGST
jgi:hypothetical protein